MKRHLNKIKKYRFYAKTGRNVTPAPWRGGRNPYQQLYLASANNSALIEHRERISELERALKTQTQIINTLLRDRGL